MISYFLESALSSIKNIWKRGKVFGFYQGLIPWAWIEAGTKGAVLMFAASEIEYGLKDSGFGVTTSGKI